MDSGFSRKSSAPSLVARTAASIVACPLIISTAVSLPAPRKPSQQIQAVAVRQRDVEQHHVVGLLGQPLFGDADAARHVHLITLER